MKNALRTYQRLKLVLTLKTVTIPACDQHEGIYKIRVVLKWTCPICDGPRGEPFPILSYDGSRRLGVDGWRNPCGHVDKYAAVREEAQDNPYNKE